VRTHPTDPDPAGASAPPRRGRAAAAGAYYGFIVWLIAIGALGLVIFATMVLRDSPDAFDGYLPEVFALILSVYGLASWLLTAVAAAISATCGTPQRLRRRACLTAIIASVALAFAGPPIFWLVDWLVF
jgi:hypothetical protein